MTDADTLENPNAPEPVPSDGSTDTSGDAAARHWLTVAWPLALLFHLLGNSTFVDFLLDGTPTIVALLQVMVALLAVLYLMQPRPQYVFVLAVMYLMVTYYKAPFIGNHEVILALSALVVMLSVMGSDTRWPVTALPVLRWLLVIAYGAIAVSKLNASFFDPAVSCAAVFGDEFSGWLGFQVSDIRSFSIAAIWTTAAVELIIPILLVIRRLRLVGVVLAMSFHYVLALEPAGHVYDFTATLYPLFLAFAPDEIGDRLSAGLDGLAGGRGRSMLAPAAFGVLVAHVLVLVSDVPTWSVAYPAWLLVGTATLLVVISSALTRVRRGAGWQGERVAARGPLPILVPMVAVLAVNAVAPYLQLRTAAAFNMYSNLETVQVDGDHLFATGLGGVRSHELVVIDDAPDDHPLAYYVTEERAVPVDNLRWFVRQRRASVGSEELASDADVSIRWIASESVGRPSRLSDLEVGVGGWRETVAHKLGFVRAVDLSSPARCLRSWGPAG